MNFLVLFRIGLDMDIKWIKSVGNSEFDRIDTPQRLVTFLLVGLSWIRERETEREMQVVGLEV